MSSMQLWTTFFPRKVSWELTHLRTVGKGGSSDWLKNKTLIDEALATLRSSKIEGVRLVITPGELTKDGEVFHWEALEVALQVCQKNSLLVDLCLGPFQYPHYPGIRLPKVFLNNLSAETDMIDAIPALREFGMLFLKEQIKWYGDDKRIRGFYLGNEWPDKNRIEGRNDLRAGVSREFMRDSVLYLKKSTKKPILFNTNIDPSFPDRLKSVFGEFFKLLGKQARLGFDPYPSRETWRRVPDMKIKRIFITYAASMEKVRKVLGTNNLFFTEVEAQPWGNGESWYRLIKEGEDSEKEIYGYKRDDLKKTFAKYIVPTGIREVNLWCPEFWLVAKEMGISWPLEQVATLKS